MGEFSAIDSIIEFVKLDETVNPLLLVAFVDELLLLLLLILLFELVIAELELLLGDVTEFGEDENAALKDNPLNLTLILNLTLDSNGKTPILIF